MCNTEITQNLTKKQPIPTGGVFSSFWLKKTSPPISCANQSEVRAEHKASFRSQSCIFAPLNPSVDSRELVSVFQLPTLNAGSVCYVGLTRGPAHAH